MKINDFAFLLMLLVALALICGCNSNIKASFVEKSIGDCKEVCKKSDQKQYEACINTCLANKGINTKNDKAEIISAIVSVCQPGCPMGMCKIPAGEFKMGCSDNDLECQVDEKPARKVKITKVFCLDRTEVTQDEYERVTGTNPSWHKRGSTYPVDQVPWNGAKNFCARIGKRLPTEAEWEYAARAGTTSKYYWGNTIDGDYLWFNDNSSVQSNPVGKKKPNAYGLHDMLGGVWEWVQDCYDDDWYAKMPAQDPINDRAKCDYDNRVLRGGSWDYIERSLRVSARFQFNQSGATFNDGFRCAMTLK